MVWGDFDATRPESWGHGLEKLQPDETELVGSWNLSGERVVGDVVCQRIDWLTERELERVAYSLEAGAWETLYRDPADGRLWERWYPSSHMHGGGPPALKVISRDLAKLKYGDAADSA